MSQNTQMNLMAYSFVVVVAVVMLFVEETKLHKMT